MATGKPNRTTATAELGATSSSVKYQQFRSDEFIPQLRGKNVIRKLREMRDNDPIIGGLMLAIEMMIRRSTVRVEPADDSAEAEAAQEFVEQVLGDMEHTLDDFLASAISFLPFGFAVFEVVYKVRGGPETQVPERHSQYSDGRLGIRKLAPRSQWSIEDFKLSDNGDILGIVQRSGAKRVTIPIEKLVHLRTTTLNNDPTGRSVLRNAYLSYHYASHIRMIEAIAIERELNGIPIGRVPASYLSANATADQTTFVNSIKQILRDVKFNDQGYILIPSDPYMDDMGKPTGKNLVEIELLSASGTRAIDTNKAIGHHEQNMARSVLADFIMLGQSEKGSFALSKSKTDLFLAAVQGFAGIIADAATMQIVKPLWMLNAFPVETMPKIEFDDIAPVDIEELGAYIRDISGAGVALFPDEDTENTVRRAGGLPEATIDPETLGTPPPGDEGDDE